jgi:hypothetical protein
MASIKRYAALETGESIGDLSASKPLHPHSTTFCNNHKKGPSMNPTEHPTKKPTATTGIFALLCGLLGVGGTRASKTTQGTTTSRTSRRLILSVLATTLGALAFTAAPALAAAPETPEASVEDTTAVVATPSTEAILHGVLDPNIASGTTSEVLDYEFVYRESKTACKGAGEVKTVPQGFSLGMGREEPSQQITGLKPGSEYTVCLLAHNSSNLSEETPSAPVTFKTPVTPETPVTSSPAKLITATTATLEGTLNPTKAGEPGSYEFLYRLSPTECTGEGGGATPAEPAVGHTLGDLGEGVKTAITSATPLQPNATYTFCLVAHNAAGEPSPVGNAVHFTTKVAPPKIDSMSVSNIKSSEATLNGAVNPNNQVTECHFQYGVLFVEEHEVPCTPELLSGYGEQNVSPTRTEVVEGNIVTVPAPITGLTPGTEYHYRIVAKNGKGEETTEEKTFRTTDEPEKQAATEVTATTATLNGVLNPHHPFEAGSYEFLYKQSEGECTGGSVTPAGSSTGASAQAVSAKIAGLQPGVTYTFCLLQRNAAGEEVALGGAETFPTPSAAPTIVGEFTSGVEATTATLNAQIDPNGHTTTYRFEYGTTASYGTPIPGATLTALTSTETVTTAAIPGLTPGTTYHYRVIATNSLSPAGGTPGPDATFTTPGAQATNSKECKNEQLRAEQPFGLTLPDCRAYEMVSPIETNGQDATDSFIKEVPRAAVSGEAVTYASRGSFGAPTGEAVDNQFISRRGPDGWSTQAVTPFREPADAGSESSYEASAFTPELTEGVAATNARLTSDAPVIPLVELPSYSYIEDFAAGSYKYLASGFGVSLNPEGVSADLSHIMLGTSEWVDGKTVPVAVTNTGEPLEADVGSQGFERTVSHERWHAVSADGSRVYFTSPSQEEQLINGVFELTSDVLYVRVNAGVKVEPEPEREQSKLNAKEECTEPAKACTIEVSASQRKIADTTHGLQIAHYWGASANGARVFFTSKTELTEDAYTGSEDNAANLYEYDLERPVGERLKDLTVDKTDADGAAVQGVVQISEEGQYVYFVAKGVLNGEHKEALRNGAGDEPVAEGDNLYVSHEGGAPRFIATLSAGDISDWDGAVTHYAGYDGAKGYSSPGTHGLEDAEDESGPELNSAVVTADGSQLAFMSYRGLTGYDNLDGNTGEPDDEIYNYGAETGGLACASCNPSGARPVGSASLHPVQRGVSIASLYSRRNFSDDGTLFFDSPDALVPHASDGRQNVYEYEDGQIHAISNVAGGYESFFMDASADGENVFFGTADQLLPQDTSSNVVVYDARVGGGFPVKVAAAACTTAEACRTASPPTPSVFGAPPSATFSGPGNVTPPPPAVVKPKPKPKPVKCKKGDVKNKKGKCVRKPKKAKKTNRRAK